MTIKEFYNWACENKVENFSFIIGNEDDASDPNINCVDRETEVVIVN